MCPSRTILIICATFLLPNDAFVQHPKLPRSSSSLYAKKAAKKKAPTAGGKGFSASTAKAEVNRLPKEESDPCGCGSGSSYADCCSKFHNGAPRETAEQVLRSRFTAYQYRLPSFLVSSTLKFAPPSKEEAVLSNANAKNKVAVKEEKTELLKFCDSYEFSDLEIGETSQNDDSHNIAFTCKLKARAARIDFGEETSDFLENNGKPPPTPSRCVLLSIHCTRTSKHQVYFRTRIGLRSY